MSLVHRLYIARMLDFFWQHKSITWQFLLCTLRYRCADKKYGYIGCSTDVLTLADASCSGRPQCRITVADLSLQGVQPCPTDLTSYFEASYKCVRGQCICTTSDCKPSTGLFQCACAIPWAVNLNWKMVRIWLEGTRKVQWNCSASNRTRAMQKWLMKKLAAWVYNNNIGLLSNGYK